MFQETQYAYSPTGKLLAQVSEYSRNTGIEGLNFVPYSGYTYDAVGNITSATHGAIETNTDTSEETIINGYRTFYTYDNNRISKVQLNGSGSKDLSDSVNAQYAYYPDGKLKTVTFPALTDGTILKSEYTYDGLSRLTSLTNYKGSEILSSYSYTYDKNGNILTSTETVEETQNSVSYTYDKLNRIATVSGTKGADSYYEYDAFGNRKANFEQIDFLSEDEAVFDCNEENQLYYAKVGNDTTYIEYSSNGYRYYKQVNTTYPEFYIYDLNGRLQALARPATIAGTTNTVMYPYIQYIWGPDRVLAQINKLKNATYYYLYNGHGDVVQVVDTAGNIINSYDYDVWGNFITKEENTLNHFTYFGQTYDESTGLYYLRARYYDPTTGRFTQQDPAEDGYNWYIYGNQNPVMYVDSSGEVADWVILALCGYAQAVMTSPDLEYDMQMLSYDISQGDYVSAAFDVVDILAPGISGSKMVPKFIRKYFDDVVNWLGGVKTKNIEDLISAKSLTSNHSKGARWIPNNLKESLAMETVLSNPSGKTIVGRDLMKDSRWLGSDGWVKKAQNVNGVEIHYNYNELTGKFDDFKFK